MCRTVYDIVYNVLCNAQHYEFFALLQDMLCQQTLELLISNYGAEAGNLAIKTLCFGGLYVAGGVAPRVCEYSTPWNKL